MIANTITKDQEVLELVDTTQGKVLTLINDEVNTFDHVINNLIHYLKHELIQAEQCATITHYKGSCDIMTGSLSEVQSMQSKLQKNGLTVEIS